MLVLTRKQNEKIQIGDNITITVLRLKGKTVRLGIQAPAEYTVVRGELVIDSKVEELPDPQELSVEDFQTRSNAPRRSGESSSHEAGSSWHSDTKSNPARRSGLSSQVGENGVAIN